MKKFLRVFVVALMVVGLAACSEKPATLESDFEDSKSVKNLISETVKELEKQEDVKKLEYKSGNADKEKALFTSGESTVEFYVKDKKISKIVIVDKGSSKEKLSKDFINNANGVLKLSCFDLSVSNHNAIIEFINNGSGEEKNINGYIVKLSDKKITLNNVTEEALSKAIPVTLDKIELIDFKCLPPNSIGTIYMQTQFKNNSDKTITNITYTYKFDNDTHYLSTYDTLLPGDTSSIEDTFGPSSGNIADAELLKASITIRGEDGKSIYLDYDAKTKEYTWF